MKLLYNYNNIYIDAISSKHSVTDQHCPLVDLKAAADGCMHNCTSGAVGFACSHFFGTTPASFSPVNEETDS